MKRRSVSIRGATWERLHVWCAPRGVAMAEFIEARIAEYLDVDAGVAPVLAAQRTTRAPVVVVTRPAPPPLRHDDIVARWAARPVAAPPRPLPPPPLIRSVIASPSEADDSPPPSTLAAAARATARRSVAAPGGRGAAHTRAVVREREAAASARIAIARPVRHLSPEEVEGARAVQSPPVRPTRTAVNLGPKTPASAYAAPDRGTDGFGGRIR